jgi:hypothetical protein
MLRLSYVSGKHSWRYVVTPPAPIPCFSLKAKNIADFVAPCSLRLGNRYACNALEIAVSDTGLNARDVCFHAAAKRRDEVTVK